MQQQHRRLVLVVELEQLGTEFVQFIQFRRIVQLERFVSRVLGAVLGAVLGR